MAYLPQIKVTVNFTDGPVFGYPFTLDSIEHGILGTNVLADNPADIIDVSAQVTKISTRGGFNLIQDNFELSTATVRVLDPDGTWNPQNTLSPLFGKLLPLRKVQISAIYEGIEYWLFSGYTQAYNYSYPKGDQVLGYVDIECADAFRLFNLANIAGVTGAADNQDTGTRINKILDTISWPQSMRLVTTGGYETICQDDPGTNRTALQALQMVEFTEQGAFYCSVQGSAVFRSRRELMALSGQNPTIFNNDGSAIDYKGITFALDDKLIINEASIQNIGGTVQSVYDADSIATYFPHTLTQQNVLAKTDADALNIARNYVAARAFTSIRIDSITLDLSTPDYNDGILAGLSLDYFNTVQITNEAQSTGSGYSTITKTLQVMGVDHEITTDTWNVIITTSEPIVGSFILDSTIYGVIGDPNRLSVLAY